MSPIQIAGFAVCAAAMALVMRKLRPESATMLVIAAGTLAALAITPHLREIVNGMAALAAAGDVQDGYMSQLLKVAGISLLMDGLAMKVELVGRVMLIALALPVMQALLSQIMSLSS